MTSNSFGKDFYSMTHPLNTAPLTAWRPDIDGVRALAVVAVVVFHCFQDWLPGGFIGVDVFFVLSGYLIGLIIFRDLQAGTFNFIDFHIRRIRRIFPALVVTLLITWGIGYGVMLTDEYQQLGKHMAGGAWFVDNIVFAAESGYFDRAAGAKPLLHLWSLGVEEQFYIVWPLILGLGWRLTGTMFPILALLVAGSFLGCVTPNAPTFLWSFYSPIGRLWELGAGSILAYQMVFRPASLPPMVAQGLSVLGAGLFVLGLGLIDKNRQFPGIWALLPVLATLCLIAAGPLSWVNRVILSRPQLVFIGLISYPLYLWHWPLLYFARLLDNPSPSPMVLALVIIASLALSCLTYYGIERPLRRSPNLNRIAGMLLAATALIGVAGWNISQAGVGGALAQSFPLVGAAHNDNGADKQMATAIIADTKVRVLGDGDASVLFYGDSHIDQYMARFAEKYAADPHFGKPFAEFYTAGCPPIPNIVRPNYADCSASVGAVSRILADQSIKTVVIGGAWNKYFIDFPIRTTPGDFEDDYYYRQDDKDVFWGQGGADLAFQALGRFLTIIAASKHVILILDNPHGDELDVATHLDRMELLLHHGDDIAPPDHLLTPQELNLRDRLKQLALNAGATVIDPLDTLCTNGRCPIIANRRPVYVDTHHLSATYVKNHADFMDPLVFEDGQSR